MSSEQEQAAESYGSLVSLLSTTACDLLVYPYYHYYTIAFPSIAASRDHLRRSGRNRPTTTLHEEPLAGCELLPSVGIREPQTTIWRRRVPKEAIARAWVVLNSCTTLRIHTELATCTRVAAWGQTTSSVGIALRAPYTVTTDLGDQVGRRALDVLSCSNGGRAVRRCADSAGCAVAGCLSGDSGCDGNSRWRC